MQEADYESRLVGDPLEPFRRLLRERVGDGSPELVAIQERYDDGTIRQLLMAK